MISTQDINQNLFDLLTTKNFELVTRDNKGKETADPKQAELFSFDYVVDDTNYGTVVVTITGAGSLEVFYGDSLGKGMELDHKSEWYDFLYQLRHFARRNMLGFDLKNMNKLKYAMQSRSQVEESKYYGYKNTSYTKPTKEAKLKIVHSKPIDEEQGDKRYRNISALYVENADGERFKLPFTKLFAGRAMARHVSEGGTPHDQFGQYICELVSDIGVLGNFVRASRGKEFTDAGTSVMAEAGVRHYADLKKKVKRMIGRRGYKEQFNAFDPEQTEEHVEITDQLRDMFTETLLDTRIEQAIPVLNKLESRNSVMKEINEFNDWAEDITALESTACPDCIQEPCVCTSEIEEGFDPQSYEKEIDYEFTGDDGEQGSGYLYYTINVANGKPVVDPKSLKATCNGDGNNKLTDEWCTQMVQPGGEEHQYALQAAQEEAEEEWNELDVPVAEGFDPDEFDGEITVPGLNNVPTTIKYTAEVDKEQNTVRVTSCSNNQYKEECQADAEAEWDARDADVPMEDTVEEASFEITYTDPQFSKPKTHTIKSVNAKGAEEKFLSFGNPYKILDIKKVERADEGKMKGLALDMEELSDAEFEAKYKMKKSDWQEVKDKSLRMDPNKPAYISKMKMHEEKPVYEAHEKLEKLVGQRVYVKNKGQTGTVDQVSTTHSNALVVDMDNGQTTVSHFTDLTSEDEKPSTLTRYLDMLKDVLDLHGRGAVHKKGLPAKSYDAMEEARDTHCSDKCCGSDVKAEDCGCPPDCPHCNCNAKLDEAEAYTQDDVNAAIKLANGSTGNMTDATDAIESIADGLSDHPDVAKALKNANESIEEMASLRRLSGLK